MPELRIDIPTSLMRALAERQARTGESPEQIVIAALADALEVEHPALYQVSNATALTQGVFDGAVAWASVSSREPENFRQFMGDPEDVPVTGELERRHGLPGQPGSSRFWRGVSARTFFDQVEDPVLLVHGGRDDTCPPRWARESFAALEQAGAPVRLAWYPEEGHAFGPQFFAAMDRSIGFFERVART